MRVLVLLVMAGCTDGMIELVPDGGGVSQADMVTATTTDGDPGTPLAGPSGCEALGVEAGVSVGGYNSDRFAFSDAECKKRTAALVRNDAKDPKGKWGGYLREYVYEVAGAKRTCTGSHPSHPGWGFTTNHFGTASAATLSENSQGTWKTVLAGKHHAIQEFAWNLTIDGRTVKTTVHWMFATGRSHPLWAVTFDSSGTPADTIKADTRAPYGDIDWDGGAGADVAGVGWGDQYKFVSKASPVTLASGWDYAQKNRVPYVVMWTASVDAEMGAVQTQTWEQHDAGGYWAYSRWGMSSASGPMPEDYNWTYQLNQYEIPYTLKSKRLAWGANYGAVGQRQYPAYGDARMLSGYPYQSYSVFMVMGTHSDDATAKKVADVEMIEKTTLSASVGSVALKGPGGVARTDEANYTPAGYDQIYGAWTFVAANSALSAQFDVDGKLEHALIHVRDYNATTAPSSVKLGGQLLLADSAYYASVDTTTHSLWLTIALPISGKTTLDITP